MPFFAWLLTQSGRTDAVGAFARHAAKDRLCPRKTNRLYVFLLRYEGLPEQRAGAKLAHREWRRTVKAVAA